MKAKVGGKVFDVSEDRLKGGVVRHPVGRPNSTPRSMGPHEVQDVGTFPVAGLNPAPSAPQLSGWPKRTDKWNFAYAQELEARKKAGDIIDWWYEPKPWRLAEGVTHKADFMVWRIKEIVEIHEVKGWSRNLRDGLTRFKIARDHYPCFVWRLMTREKGKFVEVSP